MLMNEKRHEVFDRTYYSFVYGANLRVRMDQRRGMSKRSEKLTFHNLPGKSWEEPFVRAWEGIHVADERRDSVATMSVTASFSQTLHRAASSSNMRYCWQSLVT